jgi:hypothetical protein
VETSLCVEDIKLTDELYYSPGEKEFFHSCINYYGKEDFCGHFTYDGLCSSCNYAPTEKEKFLMNLGNFNG